MRNMNSGWSAWLLTMVVATLLAACGGKQETAAPVASNNAADGTVVSDKIFDMPYLMRDLDNGLRVIVVPTDYPDIVSIQIPVQTGSRNEVEPGKSGFAHFFEHMMFRGTEAYPSDVYADILKKAGADQNAYTTDDYTNYHITFTKADLEKVIELEADRFQRLNYTEEQFRTEALAVKGEYLKNFSNPIQKLFERISALMFSVHTYKHTTMGFIEDIEAMPDQMEYSKLFFDRWYRPEKTVVILVGDLDAEETFKLVEKYWGGWEHGDYDADIPVEPPLDGPKYEHLQWEGPTQPWYVVAYRGPAYVPTEKDMPALDLISSIYFSQSSDLYRKLVIQDQAADQLFGYFPDQKDPGLLVIAARLTDVANAANVRDSINATLVEARTQLVADKKVEETKSRLRYGFTANLDNSTGIAEMLARVVHFSRTPETVNEVFNTYESLTATDLRDMANKYFVDSQRVTFTLSNDATIEGIDGKASVDSVVVAKGMVDVPAEVAGAATAAKLPAVNKPETVPGRVRHQPVVNITAGRRCVPHQHRCRLRPRRQERPGSPHGGDDFRRWFRSPVDRGNQRGDVPDCVRLRRSGRQGNDAPVGPGAQRQSRRLVPAGSRSAAVSGLVGKRFHTHQDAADQRHPHGPRRQQRRRVGQGGVVCGDLRQRASVRFV